jgi:hypothetical protein
MQAFQNKGNSTRTPYASRANGEDISQSRDFKIQRELRQTKNGGESRDKTKQKKKTNEKYGEREIGKHRHSANLGEHGEIIKRRERGKGKKKKKKKKPKYSRNQDQVVTPETHLTAIKACNRDERL